MPVGNNQGRTKYANVKKGKIHIYQGKGNPSQEVDYIEGKMTAMNIQTENYNNEDYDVLIVDMDDSENLYKLKIRFDSGYARGFLFTLPNANLNDWIKVSPQYKDEKSTIFVSQGGRALKWHFTKDNPNGLPQMEKVKVNNKIVWDKGNQLDFLKNMVKDFNNKLGNPTYVDKTSEAPKKSTKKTETINDLPF